MNIVDIAKAAAPDAKIEIVGIRPGEKLHEQMIGEEDSMFTYEYAEHYKILPAINNWAASPTRIKDGKRVADGFSYTSFNNQDWMSRIDLEQWIAVNQKKIGQI
jgi:FlaA1/EpsC-like NDP-sugar epimerase